jgi:hypothetical protein
MFCTICVSFVERSSSDLDRVPLEESAPAWYSRPSESMTMNILEWDRTMTWKARGTSTSDSRDSTHCVFLIDEPSR